MRDKITNFVLNILHTLSNSKHKSGWEGRTIRYGRLRKFKKKGKGLLIAAKIVALWYLLILSGSYLTADTGAYFNDVETISETIGVAENFCADKEWAKEHKEQCKDNAGIGNGCEAVDDCDSDKGEDEDNPGHNPDDCGDHTSAPCSEGSKISNLQESHTSNSITLSWSNPTDNKFDSITIFKEGVESPIGKGIQTGQFEDSNLTPNTTYIYRIVAIANNGKDLDVVTLEATTAPDEVGDKSDDVEIPQDNGTPPIDEVPPGEESPPRKEEGPGEDPPSTEPLPGEGEVPADGGPTSNETSP